MRTKLAIVVLYVFIRAALSFIPCGEDMDLLYNTISSACDVLPWLLAFLLCSAAHKYLRAALFSVSFGCAVNVPLVCIPVYDGYSGIIIICSEIALFFSYTYFVLTRKNNIKSDEYSDDKVYILAKLPTGLIGYLSCLFAPPVGGISIVSGRVIGTYRKEEKVYCVSRYYPSKDDCLIEIECDVELACAYMEALSGRRYSLSENNCVNAAASLLPGYDAFFRTPYNLARHAARIRDERKANEKRGSCWSE